MAKFKVQDKVQTSDQRLARVVTVVEADSETPEPRYYVAYLEGGGRGWWPEHLVSEAPKNATATMPSASRPTAQKAPTPANKRSLGQE